MAIAVTLPKLGLTMEEGTVEEWLVEDGQLVTIGMPLLRLATDKIDVDVEAEGEGRMLRVVGNGSTLAPGTVLGYLLAEGEAPPAGVAAAMPSQSGVAAAMPSQSTAAEAVAPTASATHQSTPLVAHSGPVTVDGRVFVSPNARRVGAELGVDPTLLRGTGPNGRVVSEDVEAASAGQAMQTAQAGHAATEAPRVTNPLARRDAAQAGIDLGALGTPHVTRQDVRAAIGQQGQEPSAPASSAVAAQQTTIDPALVGQESASIIPLKGMRGTIAARMLQSLTEMAQLTHGFEVTMDAVVELRNTLKEQYRDLGMQVPSLNDFVVRAASLALRRHPILNSTIVGKEIHVLSRIHMGLAVAVPGGLMVPVIRDADRLSLFDLARVTKEMAEACRSGSIGLDSLEGGTFAVTSLGTYGVDFFTPVINPGNVGILGVGRLRDSGRWEGDRFVKTEVLTLSLTFDHRVVDGAPAAEFLQTMNELLARPLVLLPGA